MSFLARAELWAATHELPRSAYAAWAVYLIVVVT